MSILDRNSGTFNTTTTITVTRSSGNFGTGTIIVVAIFGNTTVSTPGGWTQRTNSVVNLGLYSYDKTGAGESSVVFTAGVTGSGEWFVWELSSGSSYLGAQSSQNAVGASSYATPSVTPAAGNAHLMAVAGGMHAGGTARNVTGWTSSFVEWADAQVLAQDFPFSAAADVDVTANGSTAYTSTATFNGAVATSAGGITLAYVNVGGGDVTAPTVPTGLATSAIGSTTVDLTWTAATDAVGVTGYEVQVIGP